MTSVDPNPLLSLVVPCYNEERRLEPKLTVSLRYFRENVRAPFEVVFVDDGSTDRTQEMLEDAKTRFAPLPVSVRAYQPNRGKGRAVKTGVLASRGDKILVMDADFSIEIGEMFKFIAALDTADAAIGTKKHLLTQTVKAQGPARRFLGRGFTKLTNLVLGIRFTDITCGLKGFRRQAGRDVFGRQRIDRWSYDSETLFLLKRLGYQSVEVPVKWHHEEESKVQTGRAIVSSFKELMAIRLNDLRGHYRKVPS
jgi:dolichyl-phosphate beta-glucosyltransferase